MRTHEKSGLPLMRGWVGALRLHQWAKSALLLIPVLAGHKLGDLQTLLHAGIGMLSFSLCSSAVYVVNDILDIEADRAHPTKQHRPFAAGVLSKRQGIAVVPVLLGLGMGLAMQLPGTFLGYLSTYLVSAFLYSLMLKKLLLIDVFVLAGLYLLRVLSGHGATGIAYSSWLLGFSMFLFLSLAMAKRYVELHRADRDGKLVAVGRGYITMDMQILTSVGPISGWLAVVVLSLYINSAEVQLLYSHPLRLLLVCPFLLYWISRMWLLAGRGLLHEDPVIFALKDPASYITGAATLLLMWFATI